MRLQVQNVELEGLGLLGLGVRGEFLGLGLVGSQL